MATKLGTNKISPLIPHILQSKLLANKPKKNKKIIHNNKFTIMVHLVLSISWCPYTSCIGGSLIWCFTSGVADTHSGNLCKHDNIELGGYVLVRLCK